MVLLTNGIANDFRIQYYKILDNSSNFEEVATQANSYLKENQFSEEHEEKLKEMQNLMKKDKN